MAKHSTYPTLYDNVLQLSITKLKEWKYLRTKQLKYGTITWSSNGNQTDSISIMVNSYSEQPYIELDYKYMDKPIKYKIGLVTMPSNLGKGFIWYFLCPHTNKRCRKLYSIGGNFLHSEAFKSCMYKSQIQSKKYRQLDKAFVAYIGIDHLYNQLYKRYFKRHYAGKPTKKYLRLMEQIQEAENISILAVSTLFERN